MPPSELFVDAPNCVDTTRAREEASPRDQTTGFESVTLRGLDIYADA
jgi:hypothetical protein